jgi:hypothetical protein
MSSSSPFPIAVHPYLVACTQPESVSRAPPAPRGRSRAALVGTGAKRALAFLDVERVPLRPSRVLGILLVPRRCNIVELRCTVMVVRCRAKWPAKSTSVRQHERCEPLGRSVAHAWAAYLARKFFLRERAVAVVVTCDKVSALGLLDRLKVRVAVHELNPLVLYTMQRANLAAAKSLGLAQ